MLCTGAWPETCRWQGVIADAVESVPGFEHFLDTELSSVGPHYLAACFALARAHRLATPKCRALITSAMTSPRTDILSSLSGIKCRPLAVKALSKLTTTNCRRLDYINLIGFAGTAGPNRLIAHVQTISPELVRGVWRLPAWLARRRLAPMLESPHAVGQVRRILGGRLWDLAPQHRDQVIRRLESMTDRSSLARTLDTLRRRLTERSDFPVPPFRGNELLRPLQSAKEIRQEARAMRNCLHHMIGEIHAGCVYFYAWHGKQRATVGVIFESKDVTHIELDGVAHAPIDIDTRLAIETLVRDQFASVRVENN